MMMLRIYSEGLILMECVIMSARKLWGSRIEAVKFSLNSVSILQLA